MDSALARCYSRQATMMEHGRSSAWGTGTRLVCSIGATLALTMATATGCGNSTAPRPRASGGLEIVLQSDMSIPQDIDHVRLDVTQQGKSLLHVDQDVG